MNIVGAIADKQLLGAALDPIASWSAWLTILKAAAGVALDPGEAEFFASVSRGRAPPPPGRERSLVFSPTSSSRPMMIV
jgi:hypothetical protein